MKRTIIHLAAGTLMLSVMSGAVATEVSPGMLREAELAAGKANAAMQQHNQAEALLQAERAVLYNPISVDNRALLGQAYLNSGRFTSAETAFTDALRLDASHSRAKLGLALSQIALGKHDLALATLDGARGAVPDADIGLGLALAGDVHRAVTMLEAAARAEGATAKTRQNLALAYALDGSWAQARATAAQDISPDKLDDRMAEWARFTRPSGKADQVASLLGTQPVQDNGLPAELALLESTKAAPAAFVAAEPQPMPVQAPLLKPADAAPAAPAQSDYLVLAKAEMPAVNAVAAPVAPAPVVDRPAIKPAVERTVSAAPAHGNFVVQLGAFSSEDRLEAAWTGTVKKASWLGGRLPVSATFAAAADGRTLYRLAISGFSTRAEAAGICRRIRDRGGDCFVRGVAGDAPIRWVKRNSGEKFASR